MSPAGWLLLAAIALILAAGWCAGAQTALARTDAEVRPALARNHAGALVLDLEASAPDLVESLHHEFPALCIVGTHRLADDKLWAEAMSLGAADICEPRNDDVVQSLLHHLSPTATA